MAGPMNDWVIVDALERAELPAAIYRTARRLLDLTQPGDLYVRVTYERMAELCGSNSQETVRGHLSALARAGLISYRRNAAVHVMWHEDAGGVVAGRAQRAQDARNARQTTSQDTDDEPDTETRRAQDARNDRRTRDTRAGRALRAPGNHPIGYGLDGMDLDQIPEPDPNQPTNQPEGGVGETDAERSVALLTDPDVGVTEQRARHLAARYALALIREQVFQFLRDRQAGKVHSPAVIGTRLERGYAPGRIQQSDRASPVWGRHWTEEDEAEELRRKYAGWSEADEMSREDRERYYLDLLAQYDRDDQAKGT